MLRRCREESRTSIAELRSVTLESRAFPEALSELLQPIIENSGITLSLKASPDLPSLDKALSHAASRIVQEAVTNAVRHSQGRNIQVELTMEGQELLLNISDDGTGFDPSLANALQGHFGITGMKERAAKLGGHIEITASAGNGTVVQVRLPAVPPNLDEPLSNISV
jgi:signal transduction histidine kinase